MLTGIAVINRIKIGLQERTVSVYHPFVWSHIDYCATVWSSAAETHRKSIGICQRIALRAMANYANSKSSADLHCDFGTMEAKKRFKLLDAMWLYQIVNRDPSAPKYIKELIPFSEASYNLRQPKKIEISGRTAIFQNSFCFRMKKFYCQSISSMPIALIVSRT